MSSAPKIAFVSHLRTGYTQRLLRGAWRYADENSRIIIREITIGRARGTDFGCEANVRALNAWKPDGVLSALMEDDLQQLRTALPQTLPFVNMFASKPRPKLTVVTGSHDSVIQTGVEHLRKVGVYTPSFLGLTIGAGSERLREVIGRVCPKIDISKALLVEPVDPDVVENSDALVTPVPARVERWLRDLKKPAGVLCMQLNGGSYLIRVCRTMGLRIPDDVAIIGMDDVDVSMMCQPALTSVMPSGEQVGYEGTARLVKMILGGASSPSVIRVEAVELNVRESTGQKTESSDVAAAMDYIGKNACKGIRVSDVILRTQNVSRMTFYREFEKATGRSPAQAIRERQIAEAARLLANTQLSISLIAEMCGFSNSSAMSRTFRQLKGISPRKYRTDLVR